jgi:hypothetical protein
MNDWDSVVNKGIVGEAPARTEVAKIKPTFGQPTEETAQSMRDKEVFRTTNHGSHLTEVVLGLRRGTKFGLTCAKCRQRIRTKGNREGRAGSGCIFGINASDYSIHVHVSCHGKEVEFMMTREQLMEIEQANVLPVSFPGDFPELDTPIKGITDGNARIESEGKDQSNPQEVQRLVLPASIDGDGAARDT